MIESSRNEAIKTVRRIRRTRGAEAILEGPHLVLEALEAGLPLHLVLATEEFLATVRGQEVLARLARPPLLASPGVLETLADADSPRGLLAVCHLPRPGLAGLDPRAGQIWLYLDHIQDPGNLGALARVAEGLAAAGLILSPGCADPNHARALRASAGSLLRLPVAAQAEAGELRRYFSPASGRRARWIGLEAHRGAIPIAELAPVKDLRAEEAVTIVALGAEGPGLSPATRALLDLTVTIPLAGRLESLNVAVAAALVLARLTQALTPP
jgi:TrmH family RNA methyltransferase